MNIYLENIIKMVLALILGGIVGYERQHQSRPAGFRTNILVCVGAALIQITSITYLKKIGPAGYIDPMRLGAQVISGIGFLGAGTIIKDKANIRGLTTAASIWAVACIGLAVGSGLYFESSAATLIIFMALRSLKGLEKSMTKGKYYNVLRIKLENTPGKLGHVASALGELNINIENVDISDNKNGFVYADLTIRVPVNLKSDEILEKVMKVDGVHGLNLLKV